MTRVGVPSILETLDGLASLSLPVSQPFVCLQNPRVPDLALHARSQSEPPARASSVSQAPHPLTAACPALRPGRPALAVWVKRITSPVSPVAVGIHEQPSSHPPHPSVSRATEWKDRRLGGSKQLRFILPLFWGCRRAGFSGGSAGVCRAALPAPGGSSAAVASPCPYLQSSLFLCVSVSLRIRTPVIGRGAGTPFHQGHRISGSICKDPA